MFVPLFHSFLRFSAVFLYQSLSLTDRSTIHPLLNIINQMNGFPFPICHKEASVRTSMDIRRMVFKQSKKLL